MTHAGGQRESTVDEKGSGYIARRVYCVSATRWKPKDATHVWIGAALNWLKTDITEKRFENIIIRQLTNPII